MGRHSLGRHVPGGARGPSHPLHTCAHVRAVRFPSSTTGRRRTPWTDPSLRRKRARGGDFPPKPTVRWPPETHMGTEPGETQGSKGSSKPYASWHGPLPSMAEQWRHAMRYRSFTSYAWSALVVCGALVYFGAPRSPSVQDSNPDPSLSTSKRKGNDPA